jgi:hypothetical protein
MSKRDKSLSFFNDFAGTVRDLEISGSIRVEGEQNDNITAAGFAITSTNATVISVISDMEVVVNSESDLVRASGLFGAVAGDTRIVNSTFTGEISSPGTVSAFVALVEGDASLNLIGSECSGIFTNPNGEPKDNVVEHTSTELVDPKNFIISFDANFPQGTNSQGTAPGEVKKDMENDPLLTIDAHNLTVDGHRLLGWSPDKNARWGDVNTIYLGENLLANSIYELGDEDAKVTLYAIWAQLSESTRFIYYNTSDGHQFMRHAVVGAVIYLDTLDIPLVNSIEQNLIGWSLEPNGELLENTYTVTSELNQQLFAVYE